MVLSFLRNGFKNQRGTKDFHPWQKKTFLSNAQNGFNGSQYQSKSFTAYNKSPKMSQNYKPRQDFNSSNKSRSSSSDEGSENKFESSALMVCINF